MARAIRYATFEAAAAHGATLQRRNAAADLDADGYLERLAKYVPGEILAGFTPLAALSADRPALLTWISVIFLILTPIYLYITRQIQPTGPPIKMRAIMYLLSPASFVVWALNTSEPFRTMLAGWEPIAKIGKLDGTVASVVLVLGALIIPAIDIIWDYARARQHK